MNRLINYSIGVWCVLAGLLCLAGCASPPQLAHRPLGCVFSQHFAHCPEAT